MSERIADNKSESDNIGDRIWIWRKPNKTPKVSTTGNWKISKNPGMNWKRDEEPDPSRNQDKMRGEMMFSETAFMYILSNTLVHSLRSS